MAEIVFVENDNLLRVDLLRNKSTDAFINDATVQVDELLDKGDADVLGGALTMNYVASSDGRYEATLQDTLSLTAGEHYTAKITGTADGLDFVIRKSLKALTRFD